MLGEIVERKMILVCGFAGSSFGNLDSCAASCNEDDYVLDLCFNAAVRELFLNKFLHIFLTYERFIIRSYEVRIFRNFSTF